MNLHKYCSGFCFSIMKDLAGKFLCLPAESIRKTKKVNVYCCSKDLSSFSVYKYSFTDWKFPQHYEKYILHNRIYVILLISPDNIQEYPHPLKKKEKKKKRIGNISESHSKTTFSSRQHNIKILYWYIYFKLTLRLNLIYELVSHLNEVSTAILSHTHADIESYQHFSITLTLRFMRVIHDTVSYSSLDWVSSTIRSHTHPQIESYEHESFTHSEIHESHPQHYQIHPEIESYETWVSPTLGFMTQSQTQPEIESFQHLSLRLQKSHPRHGLTFNLRLSLSRSPWDFKNLIHDRVSHSTLDWDYSRKAGWWFCRMCVWCPRWAECTVFEYGLGRRYVVYSSSGSRGTGSLRVSAQ